MEEKEMIRRIKNSLKAGKSRAQILENLQKKGYKLEYSDALMKKARSYRPWIFVSVSLILILLLISGWLSYQLIFQRGERLTLQNPLEGISVNFESKSLEGPTNESDNKTEIYLEDIEITPEFLSYLLNEIGATEFLHKHPLTSEIPIINFRIDSLDFSSKIDSGINTTEGLSEKADLQFNTKKEDMVRAILSEDPEELFKESITNKNTEIQTLAGETELFAKGYLQLYDALK